MNHVNMEKLAKTIEKAKADPKEVKRINRVKGEWVLDTEEGPQFRAEIQFEMGKRILEADQPSFLGGDGSQPSPMQYCLYGVASCYAATFAALASSEGIRLERLNVIAESHMDLSQSLGLSNNQTVEKVVFKVHCKSDAPKEKIKEIENLSKERCPAVYCLTNPVRLDVEVVQ